MKDKTRGKTFRMNTRDEIIDYPYIKAFTYRGYDFVVHRPYEQNENWVVSEITTGMKVAREAKTISEASDLARNAVDRHWDHMEAAVEWYRIGGKK